MSALWEAIEAVERAAEDEWYKPNRGLERAAVILRHLDPDTPQNVDRVQAPTRSAQTAIISREEARAILRAIVGEQP